MNLKIGRAVQNFSILVFKTNKNAKIIKIEKVLASFATLEKVREEFLNIGHL